MFAQTGLALPVLGGAKPVCTDIRTTPWWLSGNIQLYNEITDGNILIIIKQYFQLLFIITFN